MRKVKQNQNFTRSPFTVVVYVIQYHLAAAEAELVNIENQMDPEGGAVSSVPAEAGELSHGTGSSARGKSAQNTAAANISETIFKGREYL